jgi:hypothetical protein
MLKNYLISAYRNIVRNRFYSVLNIAGLAIGMICAILIFLYVQKELTFAWNPISPSPGKTHSLPLSPCPWHPP